MCLCVCAGPSVPVCGRTLRFSLVIRTRLIVIIPGARKRLNNEWPVTAGSALHLNTLSLVYVQALLSKVTNEKDARPKRVARLFEGERSVGRVPTCESENGEGSDETRTNKEKEESRAEGIRFQSEKFKSLTDSRLRNHHTELH